METKLFVGNLPWRVSQDDLQDLFSQVGEVVDAFILKDRETQRSKGFGFVTMASAEDAQAAIDKFHDYEWHDRPLVVNIARPKEERPSRPRFERNRFDG